MVHKLLEKKTRSGLSQELSHELHKPVIKKNKRRKVYARFKDKISAADLGKRGSSSSFNRGAK